MLIKQYEFGSVNMINFLFVSFYSQNYAYYGICSIP